MTPLEFAHLPDVSGPRYGFHPERRGSPHGVEVRGVPATPWGNCITHQTSYLLAEAKRRGLITEPTLDHWRLGTLSSTPLDRAGGAALAVKLKLAVDSIRLLPGDHLEPGWYACQGWKDSDGNGTVDADEFEGHGFSIWVMPGARPSRLLILESRGRKQGGALKGQDGVSSRCCTPPNVRDWPAGKWGEVHDVWTVERLLSEWPETYCARLFID